MNRNSTVSLAYIALFAALTAIGAFYQNPITLCSVYAASSICLFCWEFIRK